MTRSGDQEHIKAKPYTFVNTTLTTRRIADVEGRIPAFNPLQMFADQKPLDERTVSDAVYSGKSEGEFTLAQSDFPVNSPLIDTALTPSETEVEEQVRASAQFLSESGVQIASRTIVNPDRFDFDLARQPDFARLSVRITQENVSFVSKQAGTTPPPALTSVSYPSSRTWPSRTSFWTIRHPIPRLKPFWLPFASAPAFWMLRLATGFALPSAQIPPTPPFRGSSVSASIPKPSTRRPSPALTMAFT
ncbi:hypothetical protein V6L77_09450 [Pannonibacter sp. Pt2-lr]